MRLRGEGRGSWWQMGRGGWCYGLHDGHGGLLGGGGHVGEVDRQKDAGGRGPPLTA